MTRAASLRTRRGQAGAYYARKNRRDRTAITKLHQTLFLPGVTGTTPFSVYSAANHVTSPYTFRVTLELSGTPDGEVLSIIPASGNGFLMWYDNGTLNAITGSTADADGAAQVVASRVHNGPQRLDILVSMRPGDGKIALWDHHGPLGESQATNETFATWANQSAGQLVWGAENANAHGLIGAQGNPANFAHVEPVRAYALHTPRIAVGAVAVAPDVESDLLLRSTMLFMHGLPGIPFLEDEV